MMQIDVTPSLLVTAALCWASNLGQLGLPWSCEFLGNLMSLEQLKQYGIS